MTINIIIKLMTLWLICPPLMHQEIDFSADRRYSQLTTIDFYKGYLIYRSGERQKTIGFFENFDYVLQSDFLIQLQPEGRTDSLVFISKDSLSAVKLHTIDLLYTKWVDANFTTRKKESIDSEKSLVEYWQNIGLKTREVECSFESCYLFEDEDEIWVIDDRFPKAHYEKYKSLYRHYIFKNDNELCVVLNETIPRRIVDIKKQSELSQKSENK